MKYNQYNSFFKHLVVSRYKPNTTGSSFAALAKQFNIRGGRELVRQWYDSWKANPSSLDNKPRPGRPPLLSSSQVSNTIEKVVRKNNRAHQPTYYRKLLPGIRASTHLSPSLRTVQRYGKRGCEIKSKTTKKRTTKEVSLSRCMEIALFRRRCQRHGIQHLVVLDETGIRLDEIPRKTLVAKGENEIILVDDSSGFAPRYDIICCVNGNTCLPLRVYSPEERRKLGVDGIRKEMFNDFVVNELAQAVGSIDLYPLYLIMDKCKVHNRAELLEAFHTNGAQNVKDIWYLPTQSAKRMSVLDNALIHEFKERVRAQYPIHKHTLISSITKAWHSIPYQHIKSYYHRCGLKRR